LIRIYVARHGETTWNAEGKIQGRSDPGLSPKGYARSLALVEQVGRNPLTAIYTSTLRRSISTAQPIAQHLGLPIRSQSELDEINFGVLEGKPFLDLDEKTKIEWKRFMEGRLTYRIPGAENYIDVAKRLEPFVAKILQDHENQEILIVGHRGTNRMLIGMLLKCPLTGCLNIAQTYECLYLIERNGEAKVFHYLNSEIKEGLLYERYEVA